MSSSISPSEELLSNSNFPCETTGETSSQTNEETTGTLEASSSPVSESISISSGPVCSVSIHNLCIQCSYLIAALNLEIKYITKDSSSLKDRLACKEGIEKSTSTGHLQQSSTSDYTFQNFSRYQCSHSSLKKQQLSISLTIQDQAASAERTLLLPITSVYDAQQRQEATQPLASLIAASVYSKSSPSKKEEKTSSSNSILTTKYEQGSSSTRHSGIKDPLFQFIDEHQKTKSRSEEESSKDKHQEKEKEKDGDQHDSKQQQEKVKLINSLEKRKNFFSKNQDESLRANFQKADSLIQTKINALELEDKTKNFLKYSLQTSILSQIFNLRISNLDVLLLFIEVMKLSLKSRQQQHLFRSQERILQLSHMKEIVGSFKEQANSLLFSGLASGLLAVVSGVAPIFGHIKGEWALGHLSKLFSSLKDMESEKFFENVSKITLATSEMAKATGQIQTAFNESHRTHDDHFREMYKIDADDRVRSIEEIKDNWRALENFLYQCLQMQHDTIKQLYQ